MREQYVPRVGDLVDYNGKRMVIIHQGNIDPCFCSLVDETYIKDISSTIEEEILESKWITVRWSKDLPEQNQPFTLIAKYQYEVQTTTLYSIQPK